MQTPLYTILTNMLQSLHAHRESFELTRYEQRMFEDIERIINTMRNNCDDRGDMLHETILATRQGYTR